MSYSVDRLWLGHAVNTDRIISTLINKLFIILHIYYNVNRSCFGHPSCHLSQNRQPSGLRPSSWSILASDPTWDVHTKIYFLIVCQAAPFLYSGCFICMQISLYLNNVYLYENMCLFSDTHCYTSIRSMSLSWGRLQQGLATFLKVLNIRNTEETERGPQYSPRFLYWLRPIGSQSVWWSRGALWPEYYLWGVTCFHYPTIFMFMQLYSNRFHILTRVEYYHRNTPNPNAPLSSLPLGSKWVSSK